MSPLCVFFAFSPMWRGGGVVWCDSVLRLYLSSKKMGTLYTGVTNDLVRRVYEHKHKLADGFTAKYNVYMLVYYELHEDVTEAIRREKLIKRWKRSMKYEAIERMNPAWDDLYNSLF
jgi:putative endonuclease